MEPMYANNVTVRMAKGGPNNGETVIDFKKFYHLATGINPNTVTPPKDVAVKCVDVASVILTKDMACILRDALNNLIMQSDYDEKNGIAGSGEFK